MKFLIVIGFFAIARADVPHLLKGDGYHYPVPSIPFPIQPVVDIPVPKPVELPSPPVVEVLDQSQQQYLPPPQPIAPVLITPQPTLAPVIIHKPTIPQPIIVPSPITPVSDYLPPVVQVQETVPYQPSPKPVIDYKPPAIQIIEKPTIVLQPSPAPIVEVRTEVSNTVAHQGYFYDNNPQPPFSF